VLAVTTRTGSVLATLLSAVVCVTACGNSSALDERLDVEPGGLLEVDLYMGEGLRPDKGSLDVRSHDANQVRVAASASGWGASGVEYRLEPDGNSVRLYGRVTGALSWLFGGPQLDVRIWVPREYSLDLRTSAGSIRVDDVQGDVRARGAGDGLEVRGAKGLVKLRAEGCDVRVAEIEGDVDVRTSDGEISLAWIRGSVEARSDAGAIEASHISGPVTLTTGNGGIQLRDSNGPVLARTERGDIVASFSDAPQGSLETRRGDVQVSVAAGSSLELDASTRDGEVALAGLEVNGVREPARAVGWIGAGGPTLRLYTAAGNVHVSER
jgi:hypothetical protein